MFQTTYFLDKTSNTFADNLAAFGLAFVLNGVVDGRAKISLLDWGSVFAVHCEPGLKSEWVEQSSFFAGAPFLITIDNKTQKRVVKGTSLSPGDLPESGDTVIDYQLEKQNNKAFYDWLSSLSPTERKSAALGELRGPTAPHSHWEIFRAVNPAALQGYNALMAEWWRGREAFPEIIKILLKMTSVTPNSINEAEEEWIGLCRARRWKSRDATAIQLFNPTQGKGINSPKTTWSNPGNLKGFWLLEWLKAVGLFYGGITKIVANPKDPRNAKDRKTYVLMPLNLEWGRHQEVMIDFRKAMIRSTTAVKLDILAALRYTQVFLKHFEEARVEDLGAELFGERPSDLVSGMQMAFYKNLGNAIATMNIATINLPRWVAPSSKESLAQLHDALREHVSIISSLEETHGGEFELLMNYRDFLSGNDLDPFFSFTNAYSGFIISQRERRKPVRQFSTTTLEVLFMNSEDNQQTFARIVQDEGFKNIAYAIRHSTVIPQTRKGQGGKPAVDIRYGLGQQLARKAVYPTEFLAGLSEFLHLYNAENAQLREKKRKPFRKDVTTKDIEAITALIDEFGSKVICNILVAYGYAREPRGDRPGDEPIGSEIEMMAPEMDDDGEAVEE